MGRLGVPALCEQAPTRMKAPDYTPLLKEVPSSAKALNVSCGEQPSSGIGSKVEVAGTPSNVANDPAETLGSELVYPSIIRSRPSSPSLAPCFSFSFR